MITQHTRVDNLPPLRICWDRNHFTHVGFFVASLTLLISTILTKYVALRVKRPPVVRVPVEIESRRRVPFDVACHSYQRAESTNEVHAGASLSDRGTGPHT
jgi:hypothetical protein